MSIQSIKTQVIRHRTGSTKEKENLCSFLNHFLSLMLFLEKFKEMCCIIYGCFSLASSSSSSLSLQMPMPLEEEEKTLGFTRGKLNCLERKKGEKIATSFSTCFFPCFFPRAFTLFSREQSGACIIMSCANCRWWSVITNFLLWSAYFIITFVSLHRNRQKVVQVKIDWSKKSMYGNAFSVYLFFCVLGCLQAKQ